MSTITFVPTQRGGTALLFDGYRYNKVRCNNDKNVTYWRCSKNRNCPGRAVTVDNRVKKTNNKHNHAPETPLPHHHHALLGHHHHSLHQTLQQHQLLHGLHSSSSNPFLSARHAASAAAAAALAAAANHHHHQFGGSSHHHHQQQQLHHQQNQHPATQQLQQHHHQQAGHASTASTDHFLTHPSLSQPGGSTSSYHHNLLQQFANAANNHHYNHQQNQPGSGSPHNSSSSIPTAPSTITGHHSRLLSSSSSSAPILSSSSVLHQNSQTLQANSSRSNSSGSLFLNQLSDTLGYHQHNFLKTHSSSANNNQNASDSLQAQLAILSRLGSLSGETFNRGLSNNNFNNFIPNLGKDINSSSLTGSNSGGMGIVNNQKQSTSNNAEGLMDTENTTSAALAAAAAAAIRSLQSSIGQTSANSTSNNINHNNINNNNNNRSSPISSSSSTSDHTNQYVPTQPPLNRATINTNHNNDRDSRSISISPSVSPTSVDNNVIKDCILDQLDQIKCITNNADSPALHADDKSIVANNKNHDMCQILDRNERNITDDHQSIVYNKQPEQMTFVNNGGTNNTSLTSNSTTHFLANYLAGTLKCLFAASGGLSQQQIATLGSSIQAALESASDASKINQVAQETANNKKHSDDDSIDRNCALRNSNDAMSSNDIAGVKLFNHQHRNLINKFDCNSTQLDDEDTDECSNDDKISIEDSKYSAKSKSDKNAIFNNRLNNHTNDNLIESNDGSDTDCSNGPNNYVYNSRGLDLRGPSRHKRLDQYNEQQSNNKHLQHHHEQSTSHSKDELKTRCSTINGSKPNSSSSTLCKDELHSNSSIFKKREDIKGENDFITVKKELCSNDYQDEEIKTEHVKEQQRLDQQQRKKIKLIEDDEVNND